MTVKRNGHAEAGLKQKIARVQELQASSNGDFVAEFGKRLARSSKVFVGKTGEIAVVVSTTRWGKLVINPPRSIEDVEALAKQFGEFLKSISPAWLETKLVEYTTYLEKKAAKKAASTQ